MATCSLARLTKKAATSLVALLCLFASRAQAQVVHTQPPIVFVHGNGDDAAKWIPTMWLFESNGYPGNRLFAVRFEDPVARTSDTQDEPSRSSTAQSMAQLGLFVEDVHKQTHSRKVILIGSSRGGLTIRNYLQNGRGAENVSAAILCGTPNHGVLVADTNLDSEFNGKGTFLSRLNHSGPNDLETVAGVRMLTLRSDRLDKFAQPTGIASGHPESQTGVSFEGPELRGATNLVLPGADHRELAFSRPAFAAMYRFLLGSAPKTLEVQDEIAPKLSGVVTGYAGVIATNKPLGGIHLRIYKISADQKEQTGQTPVFETVTSDDGMWGPFKAEPRQEYEFELEKNPVAGQPATDLVRYFLVDLSRSTDVLNLRLAPSQRTTGIGATVPELSIMRPEGYFSRERDHVLVNGLEPASEPSGLPVRDSFAIELPLDTATDVALRLEMLHIPRLARDKPGLNIAYFLW